jgi:tight adherence protein B
MLVIAGLVFLVVFAVVMLLAAASGSLARQQQKQLLERLESVTMAQRRRPEDEGLSLLRVEMLSSVPALNRWLAQLDWFPNWRRVLQQSNLNWTLTGLLMKCLGAGAAAAAGVYWRTRVWPFALAMGAVAGSLPYLYVLWMRARRFNAFEAKLPETLELMVRALRAGYGLMSSVEMAAREMPEPIAGELRKCFEEQNFGLEFRESMINLAARVPIHDVQLIVTAVLIQKDSGGNLAEILEKVAHVIRERFRIKRQIRVHTAQGRLTGWILACLPVVVGVGVYILNPAHMAKLWQHPTGVKLMYAAVVMTLLGGLTIRKIVRIRI